MPHKQPTNLTDLLGSIGTVWRWAARRRTNRTETNHLHDNRDAFIHSILLTTQHATPYHSKPRPWHPERPLCCSPTFVDKNSTGATTTSIRPSI